MHPRLAGRTMAQSTICPYCNAKLRLSSSSHRPARVKCHACQRSFHPNQVTINDGSAQSLNEPLADLSPSATRALSAKHENRPIDRSPSRITEHQHQHEIARDTDPETGGREQISINPLVAKAAYPTDAAARRVARREAARERLKQRRGRLRKHKMKAYEVALALGMLTIGAIGAAYLGWYLLKSPGGRKSGVETPPLQVDTGDASTLPASILERDFAPKPVPKRLIGVWELRSDDDRRGWIEYRSDNSMVARAWKGNEESSPESSNWYLVQELGDDFEIELGPERGGLRNVRFFLSLSGDDAYTLTQVFKNGVRRREDQRFVRRTAPLATPP
jgi:hypothetical protein